MSNKYKNDDVINKYIAHRCKQARSRASMFDQGHVMNDHDLFIAAQTILLCTGIMSESEMDNVCSTWYKGNRQALPFLLSKVEKLGHRAFHQALGYVRHLNEYQAAHIEQWYTNESKNRYSYKTAREYFDTVNKPSTGGYDPMWDEIKDKYPKLKGITITTQYPKLKVITIGESVHVPSPTTTRKRRKLNAKPTITIPRPAKGCIYTDEEQWNIIKKYPKGSPERREAIRLMTQEHYVKSESTLYRHLKKSEDNERDKMIQQLPPSTLYDASTLGLGYQGDYIRPNIRGVVNWKGSICLTVIPVSFAESDNMDSLDMSRSHYIDICKVIGNSDQVEQCLPKLYDCMQGDSLNAPYNLHFTQLCQEKRILPLKWIKLSRDEKRRRITKLYFPPSKYPPPTSDNTEHKTMLGHLRNYIEKSAETGQSPVVCSGDNAQQKRFRCKYMYKRRMQPESEKVLRWHPYNEHSCTFTFVIRWDKYGYYIPLLENPYQDNNSGCAWHCCEE